MGEVLLTEHICVLYVRPLVDEITSTVRKEKGLQVLNLQPYDDLN